MSSDLHTRELFAWLNQVQADPEVGSAAFELAYVLGQHMNRKTHEAWPTQETLASRLSFTTRGIRKLTDTLRTRGHIEVKEAHGRGSCNRYRMIVKTGPAVPVLVMEEKRNEGSGLCHARAEQPFRSESIKTGTDLQLNRNNGSKKPEPQFLQNNLREQSKEQLKIQVSTKPAAAAAQSRLDEDPKDILFRDGIEWLATVTGKPAAGFRSTVGQMLKIGRDDAGAVLTILRDARRRNVADPVSWIMAALRARSPLKAVTSTSVPSNFQLSKPAVRA